MEGLFFYTLPLTFGLHKYILVLGYESEVKGVPEKKKMGRPTDNPKDISIHVRLDHECVEILDKYCAQECIGKAEASRRGIKKLKGDLKK